MKLAIFNKFLIRAKYESFAPQLHLIFKRNKYRVQCGCIANNPKKCKLHNTIKNGKLTASKLQFTHSFKSNVLDDGMIYNFYSSMRSFLFLMNKEILNVLSFINVTSLVYSDSWSRSLYHLHTVSLLNDVFDSTKLVFTTFKTLKNCTVYCITIARNLVVPVEIHEDPTIRNVPIIKTKNTTKKNLIFFGIIVLQLNGSLAVPDYVKGAKNEVSNVKMTYYWIDYPSDFKSAGKMADFGSCDNKKFGEADKNFLQNMAVDGTGVVDGIVYNLGSCDCNGRYFCFMKVDPQKAPYGLADDGTGLIPFVTIASNDFDKGLIFVPELTSWTIPGTNTKHNGCLQVSDTGYSLGSKHIDFFVLRKKYYDIWDDLYESPDVTVYEVDTCPFVDYASLLDRKGKVYDNSQPNLSYKGGNSNDGNSSNSTSSNSNNTQAFNDTHAGQTCLAWVDTASLNKAKNSTNSNDNKNSTVTTNISKTGTPSQSTVIMLPTTIYYKRDDTKIEKRGSAAKIPSCNGYNCYPVHVMLITTVCVTFALMIFSIVLKRKAPGLIWIFYGFNTLFIIAMLIYCIVALRSVGPLKVSIVDSGDANQKRSMPDFNRNCKNRSFQYQVIMIVGACLATTGLILMYKFKKLMNFVKVRYTSIIFNLSLITFGLTITTLSFIVYLGYQKCFSGDHLKFVCNIAGHLFRSTVVATVTATVLMALHFVIQFFSMSMFIARLDIVRPILSMAFGFALIMILVYLDGNACF